MDFQLSSFRAEIHGLDLSGLLLWAHARFGDGLSFATSLDPEGILILHELAEAGLRPDVFTLDTGRLFEESHDLLERVQVRFGIPVRVLFPDAQELEAAVTTQGPNYFRQGLAERKNCCEIRKVRPLRRALKNKTAWITGLRREQSTTRDQLEAIEWDAANQLWKLNPLHDWSEAQVWERVRALELPYNRLHDAGFPSIGCAPCTRAVEPGADSRSGRWWWETAESRECGLHVVEGRLVRMREPAPPARQAEPAFGFWPV